MSNTPKRRPASLDGKVDLMLDLLQGNQLDPADRGLVGEVHDAKKDIEALKRFRDKQYYWLMGAAFVAGPVIMIILNKLFLK